MRYKRLLADTDLVFTFNYVIPIRMKKRHTPAKYKNIQWKQEEALDIEGLLYSNLSVYVKKVGMLIQDLAAIRADFNS